MTKEEIEKLEALRWPPLMVVKESEYLARLPWTTVPLDEYALIQAAFPRLLEERKRLLEALIALASGDVAPRWQEAIQFAEEAAR